MAKFFSALFMETLVRHYNDDQVENWNLHLLHNDNGPWVNNHYTVWHGGLVAAEANFKGYAARQLIDVLVGWDAVTNRALLTADDLSFSYNAAAAGQASNIVDGWALTAKLVGVVERRLVVSDRFSPPYLFNADGHVLPLKPNLYLLQAP